MLLLSHNFFNMFSFFRDVSHVINYDMAKSIEGTTIICFKLTIFLLPNIHGGGGGSRLNFG